MFGLNDYLAHLKVNNDLALKINDIALIWFFDLRSTDELDNLNLLGVEHFATYSATLLANSNNFQLNHNLQNLQYYPQYVEMLHRNVQFLKLQR